MFALLIGALVGAIVALGVANEPGHAGLRGRLPARFTGREFRR